jgi:hypothetical protein
MVIEVPPGTLGTIDDMWFKWIIDAGTPGPDRGGQGGKYLMLPPGYEGALPPGAVDDGLRKQLGRMIHYSTAIATALWALSICCCSSALRLVGAVLISILFKVPVNLKGD